MLLFQNMQLIIYRDDVYYYYYYLKYKSKWCIMRVLLFIFNIMLTIHLYEATERCYTRQIRILVFDFKFRIKNSNIILVVTMAPRNNQCDLYVFFFYLLSHVCINSSNKLFLFIIFMNNFLQTIRSRVYYGFSWLKRKALLLLTLKIKTEEYHTLVCLFFFIDFCTNIPPNKNANTLHSYMVVSLSSYFHRRLK